MIYRTSTRDIFFALGDPTRRTIVELLATRGQLSASDISSEFPVSAPAISQHLKVLREANVLMMQKLAQQRLYQINPESLNQIEEWTGRMKKMWSVRFDVIDSLLQSQQK